MFTLQQEQPLAAASLQSSVCWQAVPSSALPFSMPLQQGLVELELR